MDGDPIGAGNFEVALDGERIGCTAVLGLGYEPEQRRPTPVILRRGVDGNAALWEWARKPETRTVTITLLDVGRRPACSYVLQRARPTRWTGPAFDAMSSDIAVEELELTADGIEVRRF